MTATGWTWDECLDQLTGPRIEALYAAWRQYPPTHKLVAAFVGYKGEKPAGEPGGIQHMSSEMAERIIAAGGVLISGDMLGGPRGGQQ